jgi:hypothetical protein
VCASDLRCRAGCLSAADCAEKQLCVSGVCADPAELNTSGQLPQLAADSGVKVAVGGTCILNSDCQQPLVCTMGKCHDACHTTVDCPAGQSCVKANSAMVCQLPAEADCSATSCGGALVCASDLRCRAGCLSALDCTSGQVCVSGVCADLADLDVNGQLPQKGPGPVADAGTNLSPDAGSKDSGVDLVVAPADAGTKDGGADAAGPGPDVLADIAPTKLPDAGGDLVAQLDLPAADLASDKLPSTGPEVNASTPDAVSLPESGGGSPVATGCGVPPVATRYFCDDFESGISKWIVSGQDWDTTASMARSGVNSITDTPNGQIVTGENAAITMATSVDLTSAVSPVLVYWDSLAAGCSSTGSGNSVYVEASSDGGTTWSELVHAWCADHSSWALQQFSLVKFVGKKVKVRFRLLQWANYVGDGWYVDDVEIRELPAVDTARVGAAGCSAMPAATTTRYFCDDFESGVSKWIVSGQDWNTTFSNARSGTHSVTDSPDGNIVAGENASITMALSVDLTGAVSPVLVYWDKLAAGCSSTGSGNSVYVEASSDGGTTWSQLVHTWCSDHSTWLLQQLSLAAFVGENVMIRFRVLQWASYVGDGWYIDDVEIREAN